jgi:hypothetical protein
MMELQIGDKLKVEGFLGVIDHYGIYVGPRGPNGEDVVHNDKSGGVSLVHYSMFTSEPDCYFERVANNWYEREAIAQRALSLLGKEYNLFFFNCEHVANWAQTGMPFSAQLQGVVTVGLMAAVILRSRDRR